MKTTHKVGTASREQIYTHLKRCDADFTPSLSSRVKLDDYADKLFERAVSFEAWDGDVLVGMLNVYLNDPSRGVAYITNVSVLRPYVGMGIASSLLATCLEEARLRGFGTVRLEASPANDAALHLYLAAGFRVVQENGESLMMVCDIMGASTEDVL